MHNYTIGRGGFIDAVHKKEGDGCTPLGTYPLREVWYRADRVKKPVTQLPVHAITPADCWCDDPEHELYNKHFKLISFPLQGEGKLPRSFEHLWRADHAYDVIVVIGYNDDPVVRDKGSAIFMHLNHDDGRPTAGCIAMEKPELLALLKECSSHSRLHITENKIWVD